MASPTTGDVHVNTLLTNLSVGYQPKGFFADKVFPLVPVDKQSDIYAVYNKSYWARDTGAPGAAPSGSSQAVQRAPGTRARTVDYTLDNTHTFFAQNYALGIEIPDELRGNADAVFNLDRDANVLLNSLLRLRYDRQFVTDFMTSGVWDNTMTVNNTWDNYAASTPVEDVRAALQTLRRATLGMSTEGGVKLLIGALVRQRLLDHPDLIERFKYGATAGAPAIVNDQILAQLFEVDEVMTAYSVYTQAEEGVAEASATYSDVLSASVLAFWTPPGAQQLAPSAGYLFNWTAPGGGLAFTRKGREERDRYDWIEVHSYLDWVATASGSGVFQQTAAA